MTIDLLIKAKEVKDDEFYTPLLTIKKELIQYRKHFINKIVYCNCDNTEFSQFYTYFKKVFIKWGLKAVIFTYYNGDTKKKAKSYDQKSLFGEDKTSTKTTLSLNNGKVIETKTAMNGNGDFRSRQCIEILKSADIIVTNPPFSMFIEFIQTLYRHEKKFLVIGPMLSLHYRDIFNQIKAGKIWAGSDNDTNNDFYRPDGTSKRAPSVWITNLKYKTEKPFIELTKKYDPKLYPKLDNYDAINVDKVKDIPKDYYKPMAVSLSMIYKHNPKQFKIIAVLNSTTTKLLNGKRLFTRIVIQRIK